MQLEHISSRPLPSSGFIAYLKLIVQLTNGIAMIVPAFLMAEITGTQDQFEFWQRFASMGLYDGLLGFLVFQTSGLYGEDMFSNSMYFRRIFAAWLITFSLILFSNISLGLTPYVTHGEWLLWFTLSLLFLMLQRAALLGLFRYLTNRRYFLQHTAILGCNENGLRLAAYLQQHADIRNGLVGFIDDRQEDRLPTMKNGLPLLGNLTQLMQLVRDDKIQQILVALPWSAVSRMGTLTDELKQLPVNVLLAPDMQAFRYAHSRVRRVAGIPMFNIADIPLTGWSPTVKRLEDIVLSILALLIFSPVMLVTAALIKLDTPGPVLFRQKRYGYNNKLIEVYKFRSMYQAATDANADQQTVKNDPRVTCIGRFIRRSSIDELPQLFNVLLGSMSMVGPRPHARATKAAGVLFEEAVAEYSSRHRVKPGITGWAQVNKYRGETDTLEKLEKRVELDLEYIEAWSVWLDLYILLITAPSLLFSKEAY